MAKENAMSRQDYNKSILSWIEDNNDPVLAAEPKLAPYIEQMIDAYPDQRFGQIIANYICPDYRDGVPTKFTRDVLKAWFSGYEGDIFHEESKNTLERLNKQ